MHTYTAASWAQQCLNDLKNTVERCVSSETLPLNKNQLYKAWKNAELMEKQRLLIFDYDVSVFFCNIGVLRELGNSDTYKKSPT